jgi:exfoliative toxin A/B
MKQILKRLPLPAAGLMLALATLGNLLGAYHSGLKLLCGALSGMLFLLITLKCIAQPNSLKEGLAHPIVSGVLCTYPMGLMVLAVYWIPLSKPVAFALWGLAIALHLMLLILFTRRFMMPVMLAKVFPSYFIVYVGFVVASVTAPAFGMQTLGKLLFWIGLINFIWLLPIVVKRLLKLGIDKPPAKPTLTILCAPASLCLAGYMSSFSDKSVLMVWGLLCLASLLYLYVLSQMPGLLKLPFFPSYSAFTFPLVISAVALKKSSVFMMKQTGQYAFLGVLSQVAIALATAITFYVLLRYILVLAQPEQSPKAVKA